MNARKRVSVYSDARMVTTLAKVVPPPADVTMLYGWAVPPMGNVLLVVMDDGRELLIARRDLRPVIEEAPDTERSGTPSFSEEP